MTPREAYNQRRQLLIVHAVSFTRKRLEHEEKGEKLASLFSNRAQQLFSGGYSRRKHISFRRDMKKSRKNALKSNWTMAPGIIPSPRSLE